MSKQPVKVLVVDDDPINRMLLRQSLQRFGWGVTEVADGTEAWQLLQENHHPFVITDWMMPGMHGPELIRHIRQANYPSYTYVILLTSRGEREDVVSGLESGADDYVTKPFDQAELRARIEIGQRILDLEAKLSESQENLRILAAHDSLTRLLNRRAIEELAEAEISRGQRHQKPLALVLLDIDHFKLINDTFGHASGDRALVRLSDLLRQNLRAFDHVGRWGGEEFICVLPETDIGEALQVAERIRARVADEELALDDGAVLSMTVSVGVGVWTTANQPVTFEELYKAADAALYAAKRSGRNRVAFDSLADGG
jgi:diguanylate cyclase (GGDEF)-like protein